MYMNEQQTRLQDMLVSAGQTAKEIMEANTLSRGITRRAFLSVQARAKSFVQNKEQQAWVAMPGLRGIGKTTILTQLYNDPTFNRCTKIYASFDRVHTIGANIQEFITACENYMGSSFEAHDKPIALFLDEVQYLENWAIGIKDCLR